MNKRLSYLFKKLTWSIAIAPLLVAAEEMELQSNPDSTEEIAQNEPAQFSADTATKIFIPSELKNTKRLFATGEALLWKAQMDDLGFAVKSKNQTTIRKGKGKDPKFNWNWGFRVGFGYNIPHDHWDILGGYTQYRSATRSEEKVSSSQALFPSWMTASSGYVSQARASWNMHLQLGDLEMGRSFAAARWLSLRPFLGVRGAWIYQKYAIEYKGGSAVPTADTDKVSMRNNFWGAGGRLGLNSLWGIARGFSLYGDGSFSLLSGFFHVHQTEYLEKAGTSFLNVSSSPSQLVPIVDLALGFQYDTFFQKKRYHLGLKLGYEFNYFFNQNEFMRFISGGSGFYTRNNSDLTLMGLSCGLRFDF
jgi:hypothetical protein